MYSPMNHPNGMTSADAVHHQQQHTQQRLAKDQSFRPTMHRQQQQPPSLSAQSPSSSSSSSGPRAKCDQVVFEAIAKAAEIVVASRCWIGTDPDAGGASQTGSGRFNLLVPEVKSVRTILQRWKRTMHVPLRLDVYYQHPPTPQHESGERELLERWCLEYAPSASATAGHYDGYKGDQQGVDPIVQLRTVCKNIVVWLRTLYCHSRLLPAQALRKSNCHSNSNIGFSIYVVGEGKDDVSGLLQQGFDTEPKYSTGSVDGVPTPYGILGWRVYLAPRSLVRKLMVLDQERAKLLRPPVERQYSNTTTASSSSRAIPVQTSFPPANNNSSNNNNNHHPPVARSAPSRGYRRSNSDSIAAHTHRDPSQFHPQQQQQHHHHHHHQHQQQQNLQQEYQPQQHKQQQQQQQTENPRYYSRSPNTLSAPRSYHHQGEFHNRYTENVFPTNTTRGIYGDTDAKRETTTNKNANESSMLSPSTKGKYVGIGGNKNKNLSALSLALMTMKDDNNNNNKESQPSKETLANTADDEASAAPGKESGNELLSFPEKRRAALHNAPPTVVAAATGVGEYGYAYNNHHHNSTSQQQHQHQQQHPNLSSSPASIPPTQGYFRGPSTPASSTLGTTPPGYLLSATPSVGSHGTSYGTTGLLLPPKSAPGHAPPPFVRPLGFAGQAPEAHEAKPLPDASQQQQQQQHTPPMLHPKPSLDLLHSSPFHHSANGLHYNPNASIGAAQEKDGLSSFLQAEETASMEAATTFINDFYHHHYPMAAASEHDHHHLASTDEYYHHHHHSSGEASFLEPDLLQADDMPFAVEGFSSAPSEVAVAGSLLKSPTTHLNEASLMVASMGMVPQKKLALFEQVNNNADDNGAEATTGSNVSSQQCAVDKNDASVDDLTDQLADFRSFGATLSSPPLTTSVGSSG